MKTFDVTFQRDDHKHAVTDWRLVSDVCAGERQVKSKETIYLPKLNPADKSNRNQLRYEGFLARAVFHNVTGRTLEGLIGTVFNKPATLTIPAGLDYIKENIDGRGVNIYQQAQATLSHVLKKGRHVLFTDYPPNDTDASKLDLQAGLVRAIVVSTDAEKVINWRSEKVGSSYRLTLVVIEESYVETSPDGFGSETKTQYRVLKLDQGVYTVEIWRNDDQKKSWSVHESYVPRNGKGQVWTIIPLVFIGSQNNDTEIDKAPLLDQATVNLAHYRNSALYEDSVYYVGQPQPVITGLDTDWRDWLESQGLELGSQSVIPLPESGDYKIVQVAPNTIVKEAMDQKEEQMIGLGARLVQKGQAVKTATEAQADNESEHSVLSLVASNISDAYTQVLTWMGEFNNVESGEISFELNTDFVEHKLDSQMLTALVAAWQAGGLPRSDYWAILREGGLIDPEKTDDELEDEAEVSDVGLGLDDIDEDDESGTT